MPGVSTPALALPYPQLNAKPLGKSILVYGGSSAVGLATIQLAVASGLEVVTTASPHNFDLCKSCGASAVFDYKDPSLVDKVVEAFAGKGEFVGIIDAISIADTYTHDLQILERLGGKHLACTHPPPTDNIPAGVEAGMIFAVNDVAQPVWETFVTPALQAGILKCLPEPLIVGTGLEYIQEAMQKNKAGVSAKKVVVEL